MKPKYPSWEPGYVRAYNERTWTPEKAAKRSAYRKEYNLKNRQLITAQRRAFFAANPDKYETAKARSKAHYHGNKIRHKLLARIYVSKNRNRVLQKKREYYQTHKTGMLLKAKARYAANREFFIQKTAEWCRDNREYINARRRHEWKTKPLLKRRANGREYGRQRWRTGAGRVYQKLRRQNAQQTITKAYAREMLTKHSTLKAAALPPELVELKQAELRLKRQLKQNQE